MLRPCSFQLPKNPMVHIVDMKENCCPNSTDLSLLRRKRKEPGMDLPERPFSERPASLKPFSTPSSPDYLSTPRTQPLRERGLLGSIGGTLKTGANGNTKKPTRQVSKSPVIVTPDHRFEKPTAFISPISRSINQTPKNLQVGEVFFYLFAVLCVTLVMVKLPAANSTSISATDCYTSVFR